MYDNPRTHSLSKVSKCSAEQEAGCIEMQMVGVVGYWFETQKEKEKKWRDNSRKWGKAVYTKALN